MFHLNRKSIAFQLASTMLTVIFLQSCAIVGTVFVSGVVSHLRDNAFSSFTEKVSNRRNYLENEMNSRWNNIGGYANSISALYHEQMEGKSSLSEQEVNAFLEAATPELISMLRTTMTTGSFLILDNNQTGDSSHSSVYLKDYDPILSNDSNKDLYMIKGPVEVSRALQIPLEKSWNYGLTLTPENKEIFYKPYYAANRSNDMKLLGYWSVVPDLGAASLYSLTYSMPLLDEQGNAFGVIGIDVSQEYLYKSLPSDEFTEISNLGYLLGLQDEETGEITVRLSQGSMQKKIAKMNTVLNLSVASNKHQVSRIENTDTSFPVLTHVEPLKLYSNNSPYENQNWVLLGLVDEDLLMKPTINLQFVLMCAFLGSLLIGLVVAALVGNNFAKPIMGLAKQVRTNDPKSVVSLEKTGLSEIDELASSIETLNRNILDVFLQTDRIINMVNLPLGTFEYLLGSNFVTCSPKLLDLMALSGQENSTHATPSTIFFDRLAEIQQNVENAENRTYLLRDHPAQWVKIVTVQNETSLFGVMMDVTREVLENHAIQLERDYDDLTRLYNRFAFKRKVQQLFLQKLTSISAFVMFDLDNLKYINDTYGHDMGDIYIQSVAKALSTNLSKNAVIGRMSGDEFYAFLYNYSSKAAIRQSIQRLYDSFDQNPLTLPNGNEFKMRMSGGISWYGEDSTNFDELQRFADFAMYQGKHSVKGEVRDFSKQAYENESFMLSGREELNKILDNQLVEYAFQPIISAKDGSIYAYESLMRPQSELLTTPTKLIQIATAQSQLWRIEKLTFFKTLSTYTRYEKLFNGCKIFINSVPNEILKESEYRELEALYPKALSNVVMEIIENEKLDNETLELKKKLIKSWGGLLALDDYGSGYNGDISLLSMEPQIIKIDRLMVEGIENDRNRQSIIQKLIVYAKEQDILVLAEGVETYAQMAYLVRMGVDLLQGYYIGYPEFMPAFDNEKISKELTEIQASMAPTAGV